MTLLRGKYLHSGDVLKVVITNVKVQKVEPKKRAVRLTVPEDFKGEYAEVAQGVLIDEQSDRRYPCKIVVLLPVDVEEKEERD